VERLVRVDLAGSRSGAGRERVLRALVSGVLRERGSMLGLDLSGLVPDSSSGGVEDCAFPGVLR